MKEHAAGNTVGDMEIYQPLLNWFQRYCYIDALTVKAHLITTILIKTILQEQEQELLFWFVQKDDAVRHFG